MIKLYIFSSQVNTSNAGIATFQRLQSKCMWCELSKPHLCITGFIIIEIH